MNERDSNKETYYIITHIVTITATTISIQQGKCMQTYYTNREPTGKL
jgi:hypothetical protein